MRTQETDVEVFGGEVESLTTAGIEGVGVRVIVDHRQGYASAGSLDPDVVEETLREARDALVPSDPHLRPPMCRTIVLQPFQNSPHFRGQLCQRIADMLIERQERIRTASIASEE